MTSLLDSFPPTAAISEYFRVNGDKRVADLRFMQSPWEVLMISVFYVYFCYDLGPHRLMKNREAFNLLWTVRLFNTFILLLNVWLLSKYFSLLNWGYDSLGCAVSFKAMLEEFHFSLSRARATLNLTNILLLTFASKAGE